MRKWVLIVLALLSLLPYTATAQEADSYALPPETRSAAYAVIDADSGKQYGKVKEISFAAGREMLVVSTAAGERLLPMVPAFLDRVDVEEGVFVRPIPGLLED